MKSDLCLLQIMIFPEGTCTNRSGLILFKAGMYSVHFLLWPDYKDSLVVCLFLLVLNKLVMHANYLDKISFISI